MSELEYPRKWYRVCHWSREESQAVIDDRLKRDAERERVKRIRDSGPELLEALRAVITEITVDGSLSVETETEARAVIAKATGGGE